MVYKRIFPFFLIIFFSACIEQGEFSRTEFALGTVCTVTLYEQGKNSLYNDIFSRIREIENLMSLNISSSDISRINSNAGIKPVSVHENTFKVIERAVYFAQLSGGAFDPAIGPIVSLWGISGDNPRCPSQEEIDKILPLVNWRNIELDANANSVFLTQHGMSLDLGAIAKGYAADAAAEILKNAGIKRGLVDLGGNIIVIGEKKDKSPWRVGIQNPYGNRRDFFGIVHTDEKTIVTSGIYERNFEEDGRFFHHLFSPFDGYPADNGLISVTVIMDISMEADALSTAAFVLGYEKGLFLIESIPGVEAIFVFNDRSVQVTKGVEFTITDNTFFFR